MVPNVAGYLNYKFEKSNTATAECHSDVKRMRIQLKAELIFDDFGNSGKETEAVTRDNLGTTVEKQLVTLSSTSAYCCSIDSLTPADFDDPDDEKNAIQNILTLNFRTLLPTWNSPLTRKIPKGNR
ncbi:hypothetical protein TNCV_4999531 [Trichonephila clavipes]|nr:hypothetical protein TNCV_4999531 [Trichonephila clavipes]